MYFLHLFYIEELERIKLSLSAVILTKDEEKNIEKCILSLSSFNIRDIHVLDSFSNDRTQELVKHLGVKLYQRQFDNHLNQIKFALENCNFKHNYVLRIDADEELIFLNQDIADLLEIAFLNQSSNCFVAGAGTRSYAFLGKVMKYMPVSDVSTLRIVNHNLYLMNNRSIDESFSADYIINDSFSIVDNCQKGFFHFLRKHISYGQKHGHELYYNRHNLEKLPNYRLYLKFPIFLRAFILFCYYFCVKKGYLDGLRGFLYLVVQTLILRILADFTYMYLKVRK
jgi:glycosyltransferase involved in cell wall biosynthesis